VYVFFWIAHFPTAVHDSTVYRYSTLADQTVYFDNNYTQNRHPVPFAPGLCLTVVDIKFAVKQISQF
jgi:hypothetical protein